MTRIPTTFPPPRNSKRGIECLRKMARPTRTERGVLEKRDLSDDGDLEKFMKDADDHWKVGCMLRCARPKGNLYMSKKRFEEWKRTAYAPIPDDKPLREVL